MNYTEYLLIYKELVYKCNALVLSYFVYIISRSCSMKYILDVLLNLVIDTLNYIFSVRRSRFADLYFFLHKHWNVLY